MLSAYAKLPHLLKLQNPLTIVGISPQAIPQFETWIVELNIDAYVSLESWLDEKDLVEAFQQSKAFICLKRRGFWFSSHSSNEHRNTCIDLDVSSID